MLFNLMGEYPTLARFSMCQLGHQQPGLLRLNSHQKSLSFLINQMHCIIAYKNTALPLVVGFISGPLNKELTGKGGFDPIEDSETVSFRHRPDDHLNLRLRII